MNSPQSDETTSDPRTVAHICPFVVFMLFLAVPDVLEFTGLAAKDSPTVLLWLYPVQSLATLAALICYWKRYEFRPHHGWLLAVGAGVLGIIIWILPGYSFTCLQLEEGLWRYLGMANRVEGFRPEAAGPVGSPLYVATLLFRFLRLVIVVPLAEEIFWRGFLMRFLADPDGDYWKVPFGTFHWRSLISVTLMFVLAHSSVDYAVATVFGLMMYLVAVRTKSLSACVLMHATANLLLGIYVMWSQQWGYW